MDRAVARLNIERYRKLWARETDEANFVFLAEDEAKLALASQHKTEGSG
jgi:hypothetical protein